MMENYFSQVPMTRPLKFIKLRKEKIFSHSQDIKIGSKLATFPQTTDSFAQVDKTKQSFSGTLNPKKFSTNSVNI